MSDASAIASAARLFREHIRFNYGLTDVGQLPADLPRTVVGLRHLQVMCMHEARVEVRRGRHTEVSRLSALAQQLQQLVEDANS